MALLLQGRGGIHCLRWQNRAPRLRHPVLVANGVEDVMIPTYQSFALAQALPNATLLIYPDSGHAFMFQFPDAFAGEVNQFLSSVGE